jgi:hypothetical protein
MCSVGCSSANPTWTTLRTTGATPLTEAVGGLVNGTSYTFRISAWNGFGWSPTRTATVVPKGAPSLPRNLLATVGDQRVTLDWTAPTNLGGGTLLGYKVEYATTAAYSSPTVASSLADPASTRFVVNGLTNGQLYWFRVTAVTDVDAGGYAMTSATPIGGASFPTLLSASTTAADRNSMQLSWSAPADTGGAAIVGYRIERSTDGITWTRVVANTGATTQWNARGLVNGTAYQFRVSAITRNGFGAPAIVRGQPLFIPTQPANVAATAGDQRVTITWSTPRDTGGSAIIGYRIDYCTDSSTTTGTTQTG